MLMQCHIICGRKIKHMPFHIPITCTEIYHGNFYQLQTPTITLSIQDGTSGKLLKLEHQCSQFAVQFLCDHVLELEQHELRWLRTVYIWLHHEIYRAKNKQAISMKCLALTEIYEAFCSLPFTTNRNSLGCV